MATKPAFLKAAKGKSAKPPGSRTEQHSKTKLKSDFGGMSNLMQTPAKLTANLKPRLK